jgi:hypothetical protein
MRLVVTVATLAVALTGCVTNPQTGELEPDMAGMANAFQGFGRGYYTSKSSITVGNGGSFSAFDVGTGSAGQFSGGNGFVSGGPRVYIQ